MKSKIHLFSNEGKYKKFFFFDSLAHSLDYLETESRFFRSLIFSISAFEFREQVPQSLTTIVEL